MCAIASESGRELHVGHGGSVVELLRALDAATISDLIGPLGPDGDVAQHRLVFTREALSPANSFDTWIGI